MQTILLVRAQLKRCDSDIRPVVGAHFAVAFNTREPIGAVSIHLRRGCARLPRSGSGTAGIGAKILRAFVFKSSERDTHSPSIPLTVAPISLGAKTYCENPFLHRFTFSSHAPSFRWTPAVYGARTSCPPATDIFVALASSQCSRRLDIAAITDCIGKMPMPRLAGKMPAPHKLHVCTRQIDNSAREHASLCNNKVNKKDETSKTPRNPLIFEHWSAESPTTGKFARALMKHSGSGAVFRLKSVMHSWFVRQSYGDLTAVLQGGA